MSFYARASRAAFFGSRYPGSRMDPNAGVLHTTESTGLPSYSGGATAPNYTAVPDFKAKRLRWYVHFEDEMSARALKNLSGGVETNTLNVVQVELVGTCDPATAADWRRRGYAFIFWPEAPDWALADLADFIADQHDRNGIQMVGPGPDVWTPYPESYGSGGQRFTFSRWSGFYGWCGHQHVPENVHGDPGALKWHLVEDKARAIFTGHQAPPPKPARPTTPHWDAIYQSASRAEAALGKRPAKKRRAALDAIQKRSARYSTKF